MLRGGAIVNVEGATLGGFEFYIGPTDRFVAAQRLRFREPRSIFQRKREISPTPYVIFLIVISSVAQISLLQYTRSLTIENRDKASRLEEWRKK